MKKIVCCLILFTLVISTNATVVYSKQDSIIFEDYILRLKTESTLPINELIVRTALLLKETPYVAGTLEDSDSEQLIVNLRELDCTTLVENCIALSRTLKSDDHSFTNYCQELRSIRYRSGIINGYESRLHYSTDWIYDNSLREILVDKTADLGGVESQKSINFMSTHSSSYKKLKNNIDLQQNIVSIEKEINQRGKYYILNKKNINNVARDIQNGDIVLFATSINGLDYSHMGIAYHDKGKLTFIHASSRLMKVIIEPQSLSSYCLKSSKCTGISVLQINDLYN